MEEGFDKALDDLKYLFEKKSNEEKGLKNQPNTLTNFSSQFDHINQDFIFPVVESVNKKFGGLGYNLEVIPGSSEYSDIRQAVQIVLTNPNHQFNILKDPYVLVEGFPQTGSVRIATSGSTSYGEVRSANDVDKSWIESSIYNFLKSAV